MKHSFLFILFTCILSCCTQTPEHNISDEQKGAIIQEVELNWKVSCEGIENADARKAFSSFSTNDNTKYLRDGHLYESIEAAEKKYADWFANSPPGKRSLTFDPIFYDVLSKELVIATAIGKLVFTDSTNKETITTIGYTVLWRKEEDNWKIMNMHTSLPY